MGLKWGRRRFLFILIAITLGSQRKSHGSSDNSLGPTQLTHSPAGTRLSRRRRRCRSQIRTYCSSLRRLWHRWVFGAKTGRWRRDPRANPGWSLRGGPAGLSLAGDPAACFVPVVSSGFKPCGPSSSGAGLQGPHPDLDAAPGNSGKFFSGTNPAAAPSLPSPLLFKAGLSPQRPRPQVHG